MSKLSEFQDALREVQPGHQANLTYEGCIWLNGEIDRLQEIAKQALLDQRDAESKLKRYQEIERLQALPIHTGKDAD